MFLFFQNTIMEASIQLPSSLFSPKQKREVRATDDSLYKLQLIAFRNGKLFPATGNSTKLADDGKRRTVVTPVILTKIGVCGRSYPTVVGHHSFIGWASFKKLIFVLCCFNESLVKKDLAEFPLVYKLAFNCLWSLFEKYHCFPFSPDGVTVDTHHIPVNVTLRRIAHGADAVAAQWDFDLLNGQGGWKSDGCCILYSDENITTIQCGSLGNYAVLMVWPLLAWCINTKYSNVFLCIIKLKRRIYFLT